MDERRKFIRLKARLNSYIKVSRTGKAVRALTRDVGGNGVCLVTEEDWPPEDQLKIGDLMEVEIQLPDRSEPVRFMAEVLWKQPEEEARQRFHLPAEIGVRYVSIDPKDRKFIEMYAKLNAIP